MVRDSNAAAVVYAMLSRTAVEKRRAISETIDAIVVEPLMSGFAGAAGATSAP